MRILSWNCQGCGNPKNARALKKLIAKHQPEVVFLMETKQLSATSKFFPTLIMITVIRLLIAPPLVEEKLVGLPFSTKIVILT
jgi:hypothetical protein